MKILFIAPLPPPTTGQSLACQVFLDALRPEHEVEVVNLARSALGRGEGAASRVRQVLRLVRQTARKAAACDTVYFTVSQSVAGNLKDLLIYLACWRKLGAMVIHLHGGAGMAVLLSRAHPILRRINRAIFRSLGGVVVLGARHLPLFQDCVSPEKLHVVANFAADEIFIDEQRLDEKFAAPGPLRLLYLSNFNTGKGYQELLDGIKMLPEDVRSELEVSFAGAFEIDADRKNFLSAIEGLPQVHYCGTVFGGDKIRLFQQSHCFILPTYYRFEGQPISILEAYAAGCAVITTDHGGIFDVFTPGVNGYVVEKASPSSIAAAIMAALDRKELVMFAQANRHQAAERFTVAGYNAKLLAIMDTAAEKIGGRPHRDVRSN